MFYGSTDSNPGHQNAKRFLSEAEKRSRRLAPVSRGSNPRWSTKKEDPVGGLLFWCPAGIRIRIAPQCGVHRPVQTLVDSSISFPVPRKGKEMQTNPPLACVAPLRSNRARGNNQSPAALTNVSATVFDPPPTGWCKYRAWYANRGRTGLPGRGANNGTSRTPSPTGCETRFFRRGDSRIARWPVVQHVRRRCEMSVPTVGADVPGGPAVSANDSRTIWATPYKSTGSSFFREVQAPPLRARSYRGAGSAGGRGRPPLRNGRVFVS